MKPYHPRPKTAAILDRAWQHVRSVSYPVSTRWLFYRLLQDGTYRSKDDYRSRFLPTLSRARKRFYEGWRPRTLVDESREAYNTCHGYLDEREWLEDIRSQGCRLDPWSEQEDYGIIVFEANAMLSQFQHYAPKAFSLWPFGGDPSIQYKWRLAQHIKDALERYDKPVTIFYFGDLDPKGVQIARSALRDIWPWTGLDYLARHQLFRFVRGGLNPGDEIRFDIAENFEKPGEYQWEALTDEAARTLIQEALEGFYHPELDENLRRRAERATEAYREALDGLKL